MVLIDMEMPKRCEECKLNTKDAFGGLGCRATGYIPLRKSGQDKPSWCPLKQLRDIPAADVVEVIRCEECKFLDAPPSCEGLARCMTGESGVRYRKAYDFCSRGRPKGGDE